MAATIRLLRQGSRNEPNYLIVAIDKAARRNGEYLDKIGQYFPKVKDPKAKVTLNRDLLKKWQDRGAKLSGTVHELVKNSV